MSNTITATGRIVSGLVDVTMEGTPRVEGRPPFIYCHSAVGTPVEFIYGFLSPVGQALVRHGFTCTALPGRAATYGNDEAQSDLAAAIAYSRSEMGSSDQPAVLVGSSMGTMLAFAQALEDPSDIACIIAIIPVLDPTYAYVNDVNSHRTPLGAAWDVTYPAPLPAGIQIAERADELAGIPIRLYVGDDDPFTPGDIVPDFVAASEATLISHSGFGHDYSFLADDDMDEMVDWVNESVS